MRRRSCAPTLAGALALGAVWLMAMPQAWATAPSHAPIGALDGPETSMLQTTPAMRRPVAPAMVEPAPLFATPLPLVRAVDFWTDLFLHHDSHTVVLHDRDHLHVVWQVLPLATDANGKLKEHEAQAQTHLAADALRERLRRLAVDPTAHDTTDAAVLAAAQASGQTDILADAWLRLRTQRGVSDEFRAGMLRARLWLPQIRKILTEENVPEEVAVLPFVETMFNPTARSSVGAAGLWQLMPGTARSYGLKVSRRRDDRNDVLKATRVAARLLRANYRMLGSWPLAITAYNHGCYGVRRAIALVGSADLPYLIANYQRSTWGFASKNFYAEFLAVLHILAGQPPPSYQASYAAADMFLQRPPKPARSTAPRPAKTSAAP